MTNNTRKSNKIGRLPHRDNYNRTLTETNYEQTEFCPSSAGGKKHGGGSVVLKKKKNCFEVEFEGIPRGFLSEMKGKDIPCRGAADGKGSGTESGGGGGRRRGGA